MLKVISCLFMFKAQNVQSSKPIPPRPGTFAASTMTNLQNSASTGSIASVPPPAIPPRKHSVPTNRPQQSDEPDLISFTAPTTNDPQTNRNSDPHTSFVQMVDEMHK